MGMEQHQLVELMVKKSPSCTDLEKMAYASLVLTEQVHLLEEVCLDLAENVSHPIGVGHD